MRFLRGLSKSGWIIVGLVAGLFLAPAAAVAATSLVLHGSNGPAVNATGDGQLQTAEAPPSTWVSEFGWNNLVGSCSNLPPVSSTAAFIIRQVNVDVQVNARSGNTGLVYVYDGAGCKASQIVAEVDTTVGGNDTYPFNPGIAVPAKGQISILFGGTAAGIGVNVLGYKVPKADAPAATGVVVCSHAVKACG
jgi:hypothetical protein